MSEARQLHRDIVEFVDAAQNEMLTKLQYVDKIFGNVNYLTTVEQDILDIAVSKARMKTVSNFYDLRLLRERMFLRAHISEALELKIALDDVIAKFQKCRGLCCSVVKTIQHQLLPTMMLVRVNRTVVEELKQKLIAMKSFLVDDENEYHNDRDIMAPFYAEKSDFVSINRYPLLLIFPTFVSLAGKTIAIIRRSVVQLHVSGILEARILLQSAQDKTEKNWRQMRNLARNLAVKEEINSSKVIFENVKTSRIPMARKGYNELHHLAVTRNRNASRIPEFNRTDSSKTVTKETLDNCDEDDITADFNERLSLADFQFESTVEKMKNACREYDRDISRRSQEVKVKLLEIEKDAMRRKLAIVNSYAKELEENLDDLVKKSVEVDSLSKL